MTLAIDALVREEEKQRAKALKWREFASGIRLGGLPSSKCGVLALVAEAKADGCRRAIDGLSQLQLRGVS